MSIADDKRRLEGEIDAMMKSMDADDKEEVDQGCYEMGRRLGLGRVVEQRGIFQNGACIKILYFAPLWLSAIWFAGKQTMRSDQSPFTKAAHKANVEPAYRLKLAATYRLAGADAVATLIRGTK